MTTIEHHDAEGNVRPVDVKFDQTKSLDWLARSMDAALKAGGVGVLVRLDASEARALVSIIDRANGKGQN